MNSNYSHQFHKASSMALLSNDGFKGHQLNEVVAQDSLDFDAWTTLISTVELMYNDDIDKISLVYDTFLSEFPLCYGYWKKYAEHHTRLCSVENVVQVFERAVEAVPYSVGLWVDYCSFSISSFAESSDICRLFERGLALVGKDYLCNLLWDKYIEFEYSEQHWDSLANIYIRTLKFPTKKLHQYYESFKKLVSIWEEETRLQEDSRTKLQSHYESDDETMMSQDAEISNVVSDLLDPSTRVEALQKYKSIGELLYKKACDLDAKLRKFEQNIHRPYFHVKPLVDNQLENWHRYLDLVEMEGDFDWAVKLYERCLVSCAHYPEFWMRYVDFVESKGGKEIATDALDRATNIFLKNSPEIHLFNAWFKEKNSDIDGAHAAALQCDQEIGSHFIDMVMRKANMEKRMGNYARASDIYKEAVDLAAMKKPDTLPLLYLHYARLQCTVTKSVKTARDILMEGIQRAPRSKLLFKELLCFSSMHDGEKQLDLLDPLIARAISFETNVSDALSAQDREQISTLYLEFIDSCGSIHDIRKAWNRHLKLFPHLIRMQSPLKNSAKAGAVLKMVAEGRPDFFDLHFQKTSVENDGNHLIETPNMKENLKMVVNVDNNDQFEYVDGGLDCSKIEHSKATKSHTKELSQQEKPISQDGTPEVSLGPTSSPSKGQDIEGTPFSNPLDKDAAEICNESFSLSFSRRHKDSSPVSSLPHPSDREDSRIQPSSFSKGRSEYGSPENSKDRRDRSLSPRRRGSHGYTDRSLSPRRRDSRGYMDNRYNRQRSLSPRRRNSRWHPEDRWQRERNQRRYSWYQDNSRDRRDGRTQNQHIVLVDNKGQSVSHNVQHQVVESTPQDPLPIQPVLYPQQAQINQYPLPNNEQYGDAQNTQLYNQMWQYYYQQQLLLQQQSQPVSQLSQTQQIPPHQQNPGQEQQMPAHQQNPGQLVPNQQQLPELHYQQQQLYQLPQLQQPPPNEQVQAQQQQSYQYQQQQYLLYLQQLHQYQQLQQQPESVQDQKLAEKQQDQQMMPGVQHQNEDLSCQKDDGPDSQNQAVDHLASASGATDQLPEIE